MESAGLGALGFWLFIAAIIVGGYWDNIRKRDAQHETLRRMMDRDQPIDEELLQRLLNLNDSSDKHSVTDLKASLKMGGVILLFIAPGLMIMGAAIGAFMPLLGVGFLLVMIALGLMTASGHVERWYGQEDDPATDQKAE